MNLVVMRKSSRDIEGLQQLAKDAYELNGCKPFSLVEVGSYAGESMDIMMDTGLVSQMTCIDPWTAGYDSRDPASRSDMTAVEAEFDKRAERHGFKVTKFKGNLQEFLVSGVTSSEYGLVYIDASHRYEDVQKDISSALELRPTIGVAGHDYASGWSGVVRAVDETLGKPQMQYVDSSWLNPTKSIISKNTQKDKN